MCTPTDRALAIEELEHLQFKLKEWLDIIEHWYNLEPDVYSEPLEIVISEIKQELHKK